MSTTKTGREAEDASADFLIKQGFNIIAQNWRTRWCEIDIVASKNIIVYFIEVKYRKNNSYGDGLDAVTDTKLKQMTFAAEIWVNDNKWNGDYELAVISANSDPLKIDNFIVI